MKKPGYRLKVKQGPDKGHKFHVGPEPLILGSAQDVDIVIPVDSVDARHASLTFEGERLLLADLGSRFGTFRNGQRLLAPLQVFPGDRIGLGPEVILVLDGDDKGKMREEADEMEGDPGLAVSGEG